MGELLVMGTMVDGLRARLRERQLAGDDRAGVFARNRARDAHWRWVRRHWRFVSGTLLGAGLLAGLIAYLVPSEFLSGLVVGVVCTGAIGGLAVMMMLITGTAYQSMGATAEVWTAGELRPLRRHGWRIVNHFGLRRSDIDHVLIGPGGVMAVETKWSATPWVFDPPSAKLREAISQVQRDAKSLQLWHQLKSAGLTDVETVLFLWVHDDSGQPRPSDTTVVDGTTVVLGTKAATAWRDAVLAASHTTSPEQADRYWQAIDSHLRTRDADEVRREPPRPSLFALYWRGMGMLIAAVAAVYAFAEAIRLRPVVLAVVSIVAMPGLGFIALRIRRIRTMALGWLAGIVLCLVFLAVILWRVR